GLAGMHEADVARSDVNVGLQPATRRDLTQTLLGRDEQSGVQAQEADRSTVYGRAHHVLFAHLVQLLRLAGEINATTLAVHAIGLPAAERLIDVQFQLALHRYDGKAQFVERRFGDNSLLT